MPLSIKFKELTYHDFEVTCEHHVACENLEGVKRKACVRRCISYSCYQDIYAFDEVCTYLLIYYK